MGLRLREGVNAGAIAQRFGVSRIVDWARVDRMVSSGHLEQNGARISLTKTGRLLLDHILGEIVAVDPTTEITDEAARQGWQPEVAPVQQLLAAS